MRTGKPYFHKSSCLIMPLTPEVKMPPNWFDLFHRLPEWRTLFFGNAKICISPYISMGATDICQGLLINVSAVMGTVSNSNDGWHSMS